MIKLLLIFCISAFSQSTISVNNIKSEAITLNSKDDFEKQVEEFYNKLFKDKRDYSYKYDDWARFRNGILKILKENYGIDDFTYFAIKNPDKAIFILNYEIKINPREELYYLRSFCYYYTQDYKKAIDDLSKIIEKNPKYMDGWPLKMRGTCYLNINDIDKAISDYTTAINLNIKFKPYAYAERAEAYLKKKEYDKVVEDLESFFKSKAKSFYKEDVSKSLTCRELIEKGYKVDGCKDLEYFKQNPKKSYFRLISYNPPNN